MATRYYLPETGAPAVSPAFSSWTETTGADRIAMVTSRISSALTDEASGAIGIGSDRLIRQYVGPEIGVVNFNGTTVSFVASVKEALGGNDSQIALGVRLFHIGGTFATLLAVLFTDVEPLTTFQTRIASAVALANVTSADRDRLVVEIGAGVGASGGNVTYRFGDNAASDFALTSGLTTDLNPWVEFSANVPAPATTNTGRMFTMFR